MTLIDFAPLALAGLLVASSAIQRGVSRNVQKTRLALAEKGERFLARTDVPAPMRADVARFLDDPFPCNCLLGFIFLPLLPLVIWFSLAKGRPDEHFESMRHANREVRGSYLEIRSLFRKIQLGNHPIMSPLTDFMVSLSLVIATPFLLVSQNATESSFDREGAALAVDEFWSHLPPKISRQPT